MFWYLKAVTNFTVVEDFFMALEQFSLYIFTSNKLIFRHTFIPENAPNTSAHNLQVVKLYY